MQLEELREFRNQAQAEANGEKGKEEKESQGRSSHHGDRRRDSRGRIMDEVFSAELIPPPRKATSPDNADQGKRCRYHQNTGHSTEECQALKEKNRRTHPDRAPDSNRLEKPRDDVFSPQRRAREAKTFAPKATNE